MCIFCKIVNKEIPSFFIYEDEQVMAFLDISQVTKGHTLIIPKKHCENLLEGDDQLLMQMAKVTKMIGKRIMERTNASGMNFFSNMNEIAGQSVPHFHINLIPRYDESDACIIKFEESKNQDMEALTKQLQ